MGNTSHGDLLRPPILDYYDMEKYEKAKNSKGEDIYVITFVQKGDRGQSAILQKGRLFQSCAKRDRGNRVLLPERGENRQGGAFGVHRRCRG